MIMFKTFAERVRRFIVSVDGPTSVEYALLLALIVIICMSSIQSIGNNASASFTKVSAKLGS